MNAYELADELEINAEFPLDDRHRGATMLRQQADRIAELSKNVDELEEELLKAPQTNAKPVAWIGNNELQFGFTDTRVTNEKESWDDIPLYTTPQTELNPGGEPVKNATYWKRQYNQAQDRIAELEKEIDTYRYQNSNQIDTHRYEPVAWMQTFTQSYQGKTEIKHAVNIEQIGINDIPLYTTPHHASDVKQTKPLSDEEIPLMTILQNAQSVRLGDAIYKNDAEYEKLKKIVIASVKWTQERHGIK